MSTSAQRKAWNEAMRTAAGTAALPTALQPTKQKRRSDRNNSSKASRREKARKSINHGDPESREFLWAAWMDALEDVPASSGVGEGDDDDSYDELEELNEDVNSGKNKRGVKKRRKMPSKTASAAGAVPKRLKARSLASVLLEEVNRDDGVAYAWLDNEARIPKNQQQQQSNCRMPPPRKYCPVTGMEGIYTEPKTQIPYANLQALEQIRERPPPWMILGGSIAYHDAVKSIRGEEDS
ncbi:YL1 family nuclear protein [Nitzschia inconspicua]|uniref:YL1 family nuclear protein n=1 Tax=Nitzschia inconspicua TaxID=303405 RepID=A0A9K3KVD1_9STRA|nr:YL1 family nuclear protein [Nitzschia inconspicua]